MTESSGRVWQALSHPVRRAVVDLLRDAPLTTGAIVAELSTSALGAESGRFAVQRHLGVLRDAGLVIVTAHGRQRRNALNGAALYEATIGWLRPTDVAVAAHLHSMKHALEETRPQKNEPNQKENTMEIKHLDVTQSIDIAVSPERCFEAITGDASAWWGSPYTILDGTPTITVEATLGGLVREKLGDHEALWGHVSQLQPGRVLAWTGRMGMGDAVTGTVTYTLTPSGSGTRVEVHHESIGPFEDWVLGSYDYGWDDLNHRLKALLEDGVEYGTAGRNSEPEGFVHAGA